MTIPRHVLLAAVLLLLSPSAAFPRFGSSCYEPDSPSCVNYMGTTKDEYSFQLCRDKVARFSSEVTEYIQCRLDEAEADYKEKLGEIKRDAVNKRDESDRAIKRFNCYAKGGSFCP